ncbi:hypothetical protein C8A05DRAFT_40182, partial [Staphylotrichum tortipilum]
MRDTKLSFLKPVMERICMKMRAQFPRYPWAAGKIQDKLWNEKRRYRQFLTLLSISGVNYDPVSGLPSAPDNIWEAYLGKYPKAAWLRNTPIGDREIYAE